MTDLWAIVESDHNRIQDLLDRLADPALACSLSERRTAVADLAVVSSSHDAAEELLIWPAVRELCPRGGELAARARHQERRLNWALTRLGSLPPDHEELGACAHAASVLARKHFAFERDQVWPSLGDQLDVAGAAHLTMQWLVTRTLTARRHHEHRAAISGVTVLCPGPWCSPDPSGSAMRCRNAACAPC
jgi:hypothetical protein